MVRCRRQHHNVGTGGAEAGDGCVPVGSTRHQVRFVDDDQVPPAVQNRRQYLLALDVVERRDDGPLGDPGVEADRKLGPPPPDLVRVKHRGMNAESR